MSATTGLHLMNCEMLIEQLMDQNQSCMDAIKRQMATIRGTYGTTQHCSSLLTYTLTHLTPTLTQSTAYPVLRRWRGPSRDWPSSSVTSVTGSPVPPRLQVSPPTHISRTTLRMEMTRPPVPHLPCTGGHQSLREQQGDSCHHRT